MYLRFLKTNVRKSLKKVDLSLNIADCKHLQCRWRWLSKFVIEHRFLWRLPCVTWHFWDWITWHNCIYQCCLGSHDPISTDYWMYSINRDFSQWKCWEKSKRKSSFKLVWVKIILHRIISVVWLTNFLSEIRSLSNHDDETKFHILSVKPFRRFTSSGHWWSLVSRFFLEQWMRNSLSGITSTGGSTSQLHSVYYH